MNKKTQPEALELADQLDREFEQDQPNYDTMKSSAAELRRQHAHIAEIEGQRNELVDSVCNLENKVAGLENLLHAADIKNAELQAQLEAVGAGGVSALMQDESRGLSQHIGSRPNARQEVGNASAAIQDAATLYAGGTPVDFEAVARDALATGRKPLSSLARAGVACEAFGNPIPQAAYRLIDLIEAAHNIGS